MKYNRVALISLLVIGGINFNLRAQEEATVAIIGAKKLTLSEFNRRYQEVKNMTLNPPSKKVFLEDLLRYFVGVQEAEKKKIKDDPVVAERIQQEVYKGLLEKALGADISKLNVTDKEMQDWYKINPEIRSSHILIEFKQNAKPEEIEVARKRAKEIIAEVKGSKRPFEELVRIYTDDSLSKQTGGDIGWQSRIALFPTYYEALLDMKVNEVRGPIETPFGFHIIKVTGKRAYENANKRTLRTAVFDEKRKQVFNKYFEKLKKEYPIKLNESLLK